MKKMLSSLVLVAMLSVLLNIFAPFSANAESIVAPVVTGYELSWKRLTFDALDLQWVFYSDGSSLVFKTSGDFGYTWSNATAVASPCDQSIEASVYTDGTYAYYIRTTSPGVMFNRGLLYGNGTIVWSGEVNIPGITGGQYTTITVDSAGYPVIAWYKSSYGAMITTDANNDGTWVTGSEVNIAGGYGYAEWPVVIPLSSRELIFIGATNINSPLQAAYFNGSWSAVITGTSPVSTYEDGWPAFSCVRAGASAKVVFLTTSNVLKVVNYIPGLDIFTTEETIGTVAASSYPSLSATGSGHFFVFWQDSPGVDDISYSYSRSFAGNWSSPALLIGNQTLPVALYGVRYSLLKTAELTREASEGVCFVDNAGILKFQGVYANVYPPVGGYLSAGNITAYSATISGQVVFDGDWASFCHATLGIYSVWNGGVETDYDVPGNVTTGEVVSYTFTDLIPQQTYSYFLELHNEAGDWYPSGNLPEFVTLASNVDSVPVAETETALQDVKLTSVDVLFSGAVIYDGNLDCVGGFQYRVLGSGNWTSVQNTDILRTHDVFEKVVRGLSKNVNYEWRATVTNALGTGYGDTKDVLTRGVALPTPNPTSTPGGITIPGVGSISLSSNLKLVIALAVTIGAMLLVGGRVKSRSSGMLIAGVAVACVVGFTVFGWLPGYLIIIIGGAIGLGLLFKLQGGH